MFYAKYIVPLLSVVMILMASERGFSQIGAREFTFQFEGKKYVGQLDLPEKNQPSSIVVIIPGSGKTNFSSGSGFRDLRIFLTRIGFAVCVWDKAGCGKSEGVFDEQQPVQNSAKEALAAVAELRRRHIPGAAKIGLWGISRAGWICPLMIEQDPTFVFWVSVSGVTALENFRYLLESNLKIEGRTAAQISTLMREYDFCSQQMRGTKSYDEVIAGTKELFSDPLCKKLGFGLSGAQELQEVREYNRRSGFVYDIKSGLQIYVPEFESVLNNVNCPVLAVLGEKDSQIDWQETIALYERTLGRKSTLQVVSLPNCNHNMKKCDTGGLFENLQSFNGQTCDGYYDTMRNWFRSQKLID